LPLIGYYEKNVAKQHLQTEDNLVAMVEQQLRLLEFDVVQLHELKLNDTVDILKNWNEIKDIANSNNLNIIIYRGDTLQQWTHNTISPIPKASELKQGSNYIHAKNGHYWAFLKSYGSYHVICVATIKSQFSYRNQYIQNSFGSRFEFVSDASFSTEEKDEYLPIRSVNGHTLFYIQISGSNYHVPNWIWLTFVLFLLILLYHTHQLMRYWLEYNTLFASIFFAVFWILVRWANTYYQTPDFIYQTRLFNPLVYASSVWFPSLGDLLFDSLIIMWWLVLYEKVQAPISRLWKGTTKLMVFYFWLIASISITHLAVLSLRSLTIDSQISFDISNIYNVSHFTYVALLLVIIQMLTVYFVIRNFHRIWEQYDFGENKLIQMLLILVLYAAIMWLMQPITIFQLVLVLLIVLIFFAYKHVSLSLNRFQQYFGLVFIIAFFSSWGINHWAEKKEHEERKIFALKLVAQNDITTDYFLRSIERKMDKDAYIQEYFNSPFITKALFEKRIRQIYFTGYLSKYEVSVFDFDVLGNHFKARNQYSYRTLNKIYEEESTPSFNKYFRYLGSNTLAKGYVARINVIDKNLPIGQLFILLKPKLIQNENRFDELLIDGFKMGVQTPNMYSFALYKDRNLVYQTGNYPFRIKNTWGESLDGFTFFNENGYEHMLYTDKQYLTVVVTKPLSTLTQTAGLFSFIFTLCTAILVLILFTYVALNAQAYKKYRRFQQYIINPIRGVFNRFLLIHSKDSLYLRTRIQTSIIFILFVSLLVSGYLTISFINQKYNTRQTERLMKKLRSAVLAVENENIKSYEIKYDNELEAFVNELADLYDNDITLYDIHGRVLASSISKIYDEHIIASLMHEDAYYHLKLLRESQFSTIEQIGSLQFQSAYAPIFYNKNELLGYLHLPYFSQRVDLLAEISSIIIGFINLYVVLFIFIGLIAYIITRNISQPLALIQESLSRTSLEKNEPIEWSRQDEIGELVAQYNRMIEELEEGARKLAETEREGAWREIARQIAHEIKNPLTPMKLSIQHLQRAYANKDSNIEEKLQRTTQLLVNQIDMLSELATEFSSFAKMPQPQNEWINVCQSLIQIVELYKADASCDIEITCKVSDELYFDPSYFSRSIGNLIKNALQSIAEDKKGLIEIIAKQHTDTIIISVKDNGCGMTPEQVSQIFKPYYSTKIHGMGLGLPIVKSMIESGMGQISLTSTAGVGTTFTITLPLQKK
jgi:two-component system nitrogen regulation sensor histidine kinase NtrY